jgi:ERF superfamily
LNTEAEVIDARTTDALPRLPAQPQPQLTGWLRIIDKMVDKGVGAELLTKVFELQQQAEAEMQRRAFVADFATFKAAAPASIPRTGKVGYEARGGGSVEYTHTELDVVVAALVPHLSANNLSHSWDVAQDDKGVISVSCRLEHSAGHSRTVTLRGQPDTSGSKNAIQAVGSAVYYLQRYTLLAILGIAQKHEDNDGQSEAEYVDEEQLEVLKDLIENYVGPRGQKIQLDRFISWIFNVPIKEVGKDEYRLEKLTKQQFKKACAQYQWKPKNGKEAGS